MFNQPFCPSGDQVFISDSSMLVRELDFSSDLIFPTARFLDLPIGDGATYRGVAIDDARQLLLFADSVGQRLVVAPIRGTMAEAASMPMPHDCSPANVVYAYSMFWVSVVHEGIETQIAKYSSNTMSLEFVSICSKEDESQVILAAFPVLLSCMEELVLYNPLAQRLYWIGEDGKVFSAISVGKDALFGPAADGALLELRQDGHHMALWERSTPNNETCAIHSLPLLEDVVGICRIANGTLVAMSAQSDIYALPPGHEKWNRITC